MRAACVTVKEAGSDPHARSALIDMAESRSTRRAVPVDSHDRADPGNKTNAQLRVFEDYFIAAR